MWRLATGVLAVWLGWTAAGVEQRAPRLSSSLVITTNYYTVTGSTPAALVASKATARPWQNKFMYDGWTNWKINWKSRLAAEESAPQLGTFQVEIKILIIMPRWTVPAAADPTLVERWKKFTQSLSQHEQGHVTLAQAAGAEILRQVAVLNTFTSMEDVSQEVNGIVHRVLKEFHERERRYDQETKHGVAQGAVFP